MSDLIKRYRKLYAGVIYDAMVFDLKYETPFVADRRVHQVTGPRQVIVGPAFTCRGSREAATGGESDTVRLAVFEAMPTGSVVVMDTWSDDQVAHFGDITAILAKRAGVVCVVIDGYTRDAQRIDEISLPVFARGVQPVDAYGRWALDRHSGVVVLATSDGGTFGVVSNDIVFADRDGVLVIPLSIAAEVLLAAEKRAQSEDEIRQAIMAGERPTDIYRRLGRW